MKKGIKSKEDLINKKIKKLFSKSSNSINKIPIKKYIFGIKTKLILSFFIE